jgi:catechol 2,3-dioxygenase-like lactoylglutathione lyase family enzyme
MIKIKNIKENCIYVNNLERTLEFYRDKIGLELISHLKDRHVFFRAGDSVLLCFNPEATKQEKNLPPHFGEGKLHLAFEVDQADYQSAKSQIIKAGIEIEHEQSWKNNLKSFYFRDPDQHLIEIVMKGIWDK